MNKDIARYRRELKRILHCYGAKRQEILGSFEYALSSFMEECQNPTYTQLTDAFGPPEAMAYVMMEKVSEEEKDRYRRWWVVLKALTVFAVICFVLFSIYTFFWKQFTIIEIYDELAPVQTVIMLGED